MSTLLDDAEHLARMTCKLLKGCLVLHPERDGAGEDARRLQQWAKEWLEKKSNADAQPGLKMNQFKMAQECVEGFLAFLARRGVAKFHSLCGAVLHEIDMVEDEVSDWKQKWERQRRDYEELHTETLCLVEKIEEAGWHKLETERARELLKKW